MWRSKPPKEAYNLLLAKVSHGHFAVCANLHGLVIVRLLKPVHLSVADVVIHVGEGLFALLLPPASLLIVLAAIQIQGRSDQQRNVVALAERIDVRVDVEGHDGSIVGARSLDAGHAVVARIIDGRDGVGILVEIRVGHFDSSGERLLLLLLLEEGEEELGKYSIIARICQATSPTAGLHHTKLAYFSPKTTPYNNVLSQKIRSSLESSKQYSSS